MKIHCKYDALVNPSSLLNHPKNRNKHGQDQIERLATIYEYQGIRHPIIVSRVSGCIVAGHGRKLAAIRAGIKEFPIVYQEFLSEEQEYAFLQSDNAIALWSELDLLEIKKDRESFYPELDLEMLGIKNFTAESFEPFNPQEDWVGMPEFDQEDETSFRKLIVHFDNQIDVEKFFTLIGQSYTDKTKSIWYPKQERMDTESKRYGSK